MTLSIYEQLIAKWKKQSSAISQTTDCFIGFDGFTDEILEAVESRESDTNYKAYVSMKCFGNRISNAAGKSANIELIVKQTKLGGNAPIMTNALLKGQHAIAFAGTIGSSLSIEPLFAEMAKQCKKVYPLGPSGHSEAIEFHDGKIILGKHASLRDLSIEKIVTKIGKENLLNELEACKLFVSVNWTMLSPITDLWNFILLHIQPKLSIKERFMFVDLADPAKRPDHQLKQALEVLKSLGNRFKIILGLNLAEAERLAELAKLGKDSMEVIAREIKHHYGFDKIIIHTAKNVVGLEKTTLHNLPSFYTETPSFSTGAGDNFNAGFCNGLLYEFNFNECLLLGLATSGYYVRNGQSPTMPQLAEFLKNY